MSCACDDFKLHAATAKGERELVAAKEHSALLKSELEQCEAKVETALKDADACDQRKKQLLARVRECVSE